MSSETILQEIMQLDEHITDLIKKRSALLSKIRTKGYIPADMDKKIRQHWELYASERTKDTAFVRTLFKILQQVEMQNTGDLQPGKFILTPSKATVSFSMKGTSSEDLAHLAILFSATNGTPITLYNIAISDSIFATLKMLQSLGVVLTWEGSTIEIQRSTITMNDLVVHLGDSIFALYSALALSISYMGHIKYVGGLSLALLNLKPVKEIMAKCGVRITSLGGVKGIPARVESTMQMPTELALPKEVPYKMVLSLCAVAPAWKQDCSISFTEHPEKEILVENLQQFYTAFGIEHTYTDYSFSFPKQQKNLIKNPTLPLDPYHTFTRLLVPFFTGGEAMLEGTWGNDTLSKAVVTQLKTLGLTVTITPITIHVIKNNTPTIDSFTLLPIEYFPLLFVAFLSCANRNPKLVMPELPEGIEKAEVESFIEALCITEVNGTIQFNKDFTQNPWIAPSAYWIIGYAYAAFLRPAITLANPSDVTAVLPNFWRFYNTFPIPIEYEQPILKEATVTTKRRLIQR